MWDVDFQCAIAQAELEDRDVAGAYHDLEFGVEGGGEFVISTTRLTHHLVAESDITVALKVQTVASVRAAEDSQRLFSILTSNLQG